MVPANAEDFVRLVASLKADTPLEVVVLRKGQALSVGSVRLAGESPQTDFSKKVDAKKPLEATLKALEGQWKDVAKAEAKVKQSTPLSDSAQHAQQRAATLRLHQALLKLRQAELAEKNAVTLTISRNGDTLTITHKESAATLTVTGSFNEGKVQIGTIEVNDGKETQKYTNLQAVPEAYRAKVEKLVEAVNRLGGSNEEEGTDGAAFRERKD
jgi:hypothetical protein